MFLFLFVSWFLICFFFGEGGGGGGREMSVKANKVNLKRDRYLGYLQALLVPNLASFYLITFCTYMYLLLFTFSFFFL